MAMSLQKLTGRLVLLAAVAGALSACGTGTYGGVSLGSTGYYDRGYAAQSHYGWYGDRYYPGTGIYVYDNNRRAYRWNDSQRRYWEARRYRGDRRALRADWRDFRQDRRQRVVREIRRDVRQDARQDARRDARQDARRDARQDARRDVRRDARQDARQDRREVRRDRRGDRRERRRGNPRSD